MSKKGGDHAASYAKGLNHHWTPER